MAVSSAEDRTLRVDGGNRKILGARVRCNEVVLRCLKHAGWDEISLRKIVASQGVYRTWEKFYIKCATIFSYKHGKSLLKRPRTCSSTVLVRF